MNLLAKALTAIAATVVLAASSAAVAGPCKGVHFRFKNEFEVGNTGVEIKVKSVLVFGNDKKWVENIGNKTIDPGRSYKTNGRRLQGLDSGSGASFRVSFDHRKIGPGWQSASILFANRPECVDDMTYLFIIK